MAVTSKFDVSGGRWVAETDDGEFRAEGGTVSEAYLRLADQLHDALNEVRPKSKGDE